MHSLLTLLSTVLLLLSAFVITVNSQNTIEYHVWAAGGSDDNDGRSKETAFKTLEAAHRALSANRSETGGTYVYLHEGTYWLNKTLEITGNLFPGTNVSNPIVFTRVEGEERPVVTGGLEVPETSDTRVRSLIRRCGEGWTRPCAPKSL